MIDPSQFEVEAMIAGGELGGEYLDSIGKTDIGALEYDEYMQFVESIVTGYQDKLRELEGDE